MSQAHLAGEEVRRPLVAAGRARQAMFLLAMGAAACAIAVVVPQMSAKNVIMGTVGLGGLIGLFVSGRPKEVLIAAYVLALTYNRQYFSFDGMLGDDGSRGLYWVPADLPLLLLGAVQLGERALGIAPRASAAQALPMPAAVIAWPAIVFLVACVGSMLMAERADWAFYELLRVVKFTLIVVWLQRTMTTSMWWTAVAALALAVVLQAALGVLQVAVRADRSLLSAIGLGTDAVLMDADGNVQMLENRARGTFGHPNVLAPYLLALLPAALGVAIYSRLRRLRLLAAAILLLGIAGVIASKSRAPIALLVLTLGFTAAAAVVDRRLSLRAALSGLLFAIVLATVLALPFLEPILERLQGDWRASVSFRSSYNDAAIAMWDESPVFGIGLNNFVGGLARFNHFFYTIAIEVDRQRAGAALRALAPVHNVYLLILAEAGLAGLVGFVVLLGGVLARMLRAFLVSAGAVRGLWLGFAAGLLAQCGQQLVDFSLWIDPYWYTLALMMALAGATPGLRPVLR
jgi:putative inorganic carbon (hco3(-)) transporter